MTVVRMRCDGRPDVMYVSVVCLSLRESGNERRATCTLGEIQMGLIRMRICATCHQEMCATCYQGEGSLQLSELIIIEKTACIGHPKEQPS